MKEKAAKFSPKLTQPLASMSPTKQNVAQTTPFAQPRDESTTHIPTITYSSWSSLTDLLKARLMEKWHLCPSPLK